MNGEKTQFWSVGEVALFCCDIFPPGNNAPSRFCCSFFQGFFLCAIVCDSSARQTLILNHHQSVKAAAAKGAEKRGILEEDSGGKDSLFLLSIQWESWLNSLAKKTTWLPPGNTLLTLCVCSTGYIELQNGERENLWGLCFGGLFFYLYRLDTLSLSFSLSVSVRLVLWRRADLLPFPLLQRTNFVCLLLPLVSPHLHFVLFRTLLKSPALTFWPFPPPL